MKNCTKCGQAIPESAKFCSYCGEVAQEAQTEQNAYTAPEEKTTYYTAPAAEVPVSNREEEQKCLDSLSTRLKWERVAWKVSGIVFLVVAIVFIVISSIMGIVGVALMANESDMSVDSYNYEYNHDGYSDDYYYDSYDYYDDYSSSVDAGATAVRGVGISICILYGFIGTMFLAIAIVNLVMTKKVGKYRDKIYTDCRDAVDHATSVGSIVLAAFFNEIALVFIIINFILTKNNKAKFDRIKETQAMYNAQQYPNI